MGKLVRADYRILRVPRGSQSASGAFGRLIDRTREYFFYRERASGSRDHRQTDRARVVATANSHGLPVNHSDDTARSPAVNIKCDADAGMAYIHTYTRRLRAK